MVTNSIDRRVSHWADRRKLYQTLDQMEEVRRSVFLSVLLDEANYVELAERHGISVHEVEAHVAAGILTLHRAIEETDSLPWWWQLFLR